jgi:hypothetical protein
VFQSFQNVFFEVRSFCKFSCHNTGADTLRTELIKWRQSNFSWHRHKYVDPVTGIHLFSLPFTYPPEEYATYWYNKHSITATTLTIIWRMAISDTSCKRYSVTLHCLENHTQSAFFAWHPEKNKCILKITRFLDFVQRPEF